MNKEELKITTFEDDKGYVFISYSSADEEKVFNDFVVPLQEKYGLRIFCDKNFKNRANQTWTKQMRNNISAAQACLLFISSTYAASYACLLEVLIATYKKIPILKIQLEEPNITKRFNERSISDSTRKEFVKIGKQLENAEFKDANNCYLDIQECIEEGKISEYDVSTVFCEYLSKISVTKLNQRDGLEAIKASLEQIQKGKKSACVFEEECYSEVAKNTDEAEDEAQTVQQGNSVSTNNLDFWGNFIAYVGDAPVIPNTNYRMPEKLPYTHDSWTELKGVRNIKIELALKKVDNTIRCTIIIPPNKHCLYNRIKLYKDELEEKSKKINAQMEWDGESQGKRIKFQTLRSVTDEKKDFEFLIKAIELIHESVVPLLVNDVSEV
ncbi:MAG: toll/interleukin-1 receptor domain-containing protein [Lachnospiraceae bacterium]|nr:toll/interleukin-1 receptor domain-containing protein [Lachnospiraceae bacterium]